MASPRSIWRGQIQVALVSINVTIGKATFEAQEERLKSLCTCHGQPIERHERCAKTGERPEGKVKGVQLDSGRWKRLSRKQQEKIDEVTSSKTLELLCIDELSNFPLEFSESTYYVRPATNADKKAFRTFVYALWAKHLGMAVKWFHRNHDNLAVLRPIVVDNGPVLVMQVIPFIDEFRRPGDLESDFRSVDMNIAEVTAMEDLLASSVKPFKWVDYRDEGLRVRSEITEDILARQKSRQDRPTIPSLLDALEASLRE